MVQGTRLTLCQCGTACSDLNEVRYNSSLVAGMVSILFQVAHRGKRYFKLI